MDSYHTGKRTPILPLPNTNIDFANGDSTASAPQPNSHWNIAPEPGRSSETFLLRHHPLRQDNTFNFDPSQPPSNLCLQRDLYGDPSTNNTHYYKPGHFGWPVTFPQVPFQVARMIHNTDSLDASGFDVSPVQSVGSQHSEEVGGLSQSHQDAGVANSERFPSPYARPRLVEQPLPQCESTSTPTRQGLSAGLNGFQNFSSSNKSVSQMSDIVGPVAQPPDPQDCDDDQRDTRPAFGSLQKVACTTSHTPQSSLPQLNSQPEKDLTLTNGDDSPFLGGQSSPFIGSIQPQFINVTGGQLIFVPTPQHCSCSMRLSQIRMVNQFHAPATRTAPPLPATRNRGVQPKAASLIAPSGQKLSSLTQAAPHMLEFRVYDPAEFAAANRSRRGTVTSRRSKRHKPVDRKSPWMAIEYRYPS